MKKKIYLKSWNLKDFHETKAAFKVLKPTHVIHCAGRVGGLGGNLNAKGEYYYDNIMINTNVIEACRKSGVKKLICFLSNFIPMSSLLYVPLHQE